MLSRRKYRAEVGDLKAGMTVKIGFRWMYIHSIDALYLKAYRRATVSYVHSRKKGAFTEFIPAGSPVWVRGVAPAVTPTVRVVAEKTPDVINTITGPVHGNVRQIGHVRGSVNFDEE